MIYYIHIMKAVSGMISGGRGNLIILPFVSLHAVKVSEWIMLDGTGKPLTHSYFPGNAFAC